MFSSFFFFFSSRRRHTRCALVTGVQTCALPISRRSSRAAPQDGGSIAPEGHILPERVERSVARPFAGRHSIKSGRRLPEPVTIDPEIGQNPLDIDSRLARRDALDEEQRSEEHTSELQSLMRISYAVFCLKKKNSTKNKK